MRKALAVILLFATVALHAQGDVEYRMEIGGGLGLMSYTGDFSDGVFANPAPMASVLIRRVINPYHGFKLNLSVGTLKGSSADVKTYYPDMADKPYEFSNTMADLSATYEYNFWPYGTGRDYRGAKRLSPFIFLGLEATFAKGDKNVFTASLPIGFGVKYKLADRLNLGVEWGAHFSLSDKLDGAPDPYHIESSGIFKNTDCFTAIQATITYSFMAKCRTCHNEDE